MQAGSKYFKVSVMFQAVPKGARKPRGMRELVANRDGHHALTDEEIKRYTEQAWTHIDSLKLRTTPDVAVLTFNKAEYDGVFETVMISYGDNAVRIHRVIA